MAWKDIRLSGKLMTGFGIVILLLTVVGVWAIIGINQIVGNAQQVIGGNQFRSDIAQREVDHLNWAIGLNALLVDENVNEITVETDPTQCAFGRWYYSDARREIEVAVPELAPLLAAIEEPHNALHASAVSLGNQYVRVDPALGSELRDMEVEQLAWMNNVKRVFIDPDATEFTDVELDHTQTSLGQFLYSDATAMQRASDPVFDAAISPIYGPQEEVHASAAVIAENLALGRKEAMRQFYQENTEPLGFETLTAIESLIDWHDGQIASLNQATNTYAVATTPALEQVQSLLTQIAQVSRDNVMTDAIMLTSAQQTRFGVLITVIVAVVAGAALALLIARGIVRPLVKGVSFSSEIALGDLNATLDIEQRDEIGQLADSMREMQSALQAKANIVKSFSEGDFTVDVEKSSEKDGLGDSLIVMREALNDILNQVRVSVDQVAAGASQVSSSSQDLSQGATESASSLEEISASINQIQGQSKENMDNAVEASNLSRQAASDAVGGQERMAELKGAMETMSDASTEIARIVKVIDDIAFQINLLALNANVEAARAGKYGKGFAVVAEEVRNLAVRSAEAVKETTVIVEQSVKSINDGTEMTGATADQLDAIVQGAGKVAEFLEEISQASREQSTAIDQISDGLGQVDQVTQSNTASAEESAAASEELSSQAEQLRVAVSRFRLIDHGSGFAQIPASPKSQQPARLAPRPRQSAPGSGNGSSGNGATGQSKPRTQAPPQRASAAEDEPRVVLDDDSFDRF